MTTMTYQPSVESHLSVSPVLPSTPFDRIARVLGQTGCDLPRVTDETLHVFFHHLSRQIESGQTVYHPDRTYPCHIGTIATLLDPLQQSEDALFSGILCRIEKAGYVMDVPIVELGIPRDCSAAAAIEDYRYWFWNWK